MARDITDAQLNVGEGEKNKDWHKAYHDRLIRRAQFDTEGLNELMYAYDYFHGYIDAERDHNHVIVSSSGVKYPTDFINYNEIIGIVDLIISEMHKKGHDITIYANSKHALSRKHQAKIEMEVDFALSGLYEQEQELSGIPVLREDMPLTNEELSEKKSNYKEQGEVIYQRLIDDWTTRNRWNAMRDSLAEDSLVGARCFVQSILTKHGPRPKVLDPRTVIWDQSCQSPWLDDAQFIGTVEYLPLQRVREMYDISPQMVKELRDATTSSDIMQIGTLAGKNTFPVFRTYQGEEQVLVSRLEWKDVRKKVGLHYMSKNGVSHFQLKGAEVDPEDKKKKIDSVSRRKKAVSQKQIDVEIVRVCVVVGGKHVVHHGELENMVRTADDSWTKTGFSICGYLPKWKFGRNVSIVQQVIPLQKLKDQALYQIRKQFKHDRGTFFLNDVAQLPEEFDINDQMYLAEVLGQVPINSRKHGTNANYNQFQVVDASIRWDSVRSYMEIARMASREIERITGMSPARTGGIEAASQAVGVTEISRQQSQLRTERFYEGFDIFTEKLMELIVGQHKIHFTRNPDKYAHIVGDDGIRFLQEDSNFGLDDYGARVSTSFVSDEQKQALREMIPLGVQAGQIDFLNALLLLMEENPREAMEDVKLFIEKQEKQRAEAQRRMEMAEQAARQQSLAMEQGKMQEESRKQQELLQSQEHINAGKNRMQLLKERMRSGHETQESARQRLLQRDLEKMRQVANRKSENLKSSK